MEKKSGTGISRLINALGWSLDRLVEPSRRTFEDWGVGQASSPLVLIYNPDILGELPSGARLVDQQDARGDLVIWFVRSCAELEERIPNMALQLEHGSMWIAWPKKASGVTSDLSQQRVRETGLAAGLVDYKICSIDEIWSGLLFTRRKPRSRTR